MSVAVNACTHVSHLGQWSPGIFTVFRSKTMMEMGPGICLVILDILVASVI